MSAVFNYQDNEFYQNMLTNLDSITVNRIPNLDNELLNNEYVDIDLDECTIFKFTKTQQKR